MIKPNELRIGNLIQVEPTFDPAYMGSIVDVLCDSVNTPRHQGLTYEMINGLLLTEKWLNLFGFYQLPHYTVGNNWLMDYGLTSQISISCIESCNMMIWLACVDKNKRPTDLVCLWNWDVNGTMHVHQLQNLYFALTGKELTQITD